MITERGTIIRPASFLEPPRRRQLRRLAVLRVMLRPRAATRLLAELAGQADVHRVAVGVVIKACAATHVPRR